MTNLWIIALSPLFSTALPAEAPRAEHEVLSHGYEATAELEALRMEDPDDAAVLINLASAYLEAGRTEMARDAYRAALLADRVELELASGEWEDSRVLAREGLAQVSRLPAWTAR